MAGPLHQKYIPSPHFSHPRPLSRYGEPQGKGPHTYNASKPSISPLSPPRGPKFHYMSRKGSPFFVSEHLAPETS